MGKTMSEKILARAANLDQVTAGEIIWANVDTAMMDDILGPRVEIAEGMQAIQDIIWDPDRVVIIADHYTPPASVKQAEIVKFTRDWAAAHGIRNYFEFQGPCHQIMAEKGFVKPGQLVLGTDSHTCMGGAFGAFATGIGSTEMMGVLITGKIWLRVPETIRIEWDGNLADGIMAKDISLSSIGAIGHSGATYKTVEYAGSAISKLCMDERMAITNMVVEMGAKAGMMEVDEKTFDYLSSHAGFENTKHISSDFNAVYNKKLHFSADTLTPMVACPHEVDNVYPVLSQISENIHQAYIGSCTGGRLHDLEAALRILKGKRIHKSIRLLISPASQSIWQQAAKEGILQGLADSGAIILAPTCGVCVGLHSGLLAAGETCISSTNRNFIGRMGSKEANIYLASPMTVAASALTGRITDPREFV
ncbi:MAG: 3-isopropylmalate dehydratase large subunit [Christensenellales bacterium]